MFLADFVLSIPTGGPADVEVVVGVDALLPVVLDPDRAPQGLVPARPPLFFAREIRVAVCC